MTLWSELLACNGELLVPQLEVLPLPEGNRLLYLAAAEVSAER